MNNALKFLPLVAVAVLLTACQSAVTGADNTADQKSASAQSTAAKPAVEKTACTDPRPQMCTMDYSPVCATDKNDQQKTAANACGACSDASVLSYTQGEC